MCRRTRRHGGSSRSRPPSGAIQTELNAGLVGTAVDVLVDAASRRRDTEVSGRTSQNVVVNMPGPAAWIGRTVRVTVERAGAHSVWGQAGRYAD